jgi:hypothetical protein
MGTGTWDAENGIADRQALQIFDQNFARGSYGTTTLARSYTESNGSVVGTASVTVPMALMQIFGEDEKTISVRCKAELRIPHSDVMFVLDTTGSMKSRPNPLSTSGPTKIDGLKTAVKCFYEALAKKNVTDVSPADCGETADPTATNMGNVQLRFGFVPYAQNVNVGRLLPPSYVVDEWTYQSREAFNDTTTARTYTTGRQSDPIVDSTRTGTLLDTPWVDEANNRNSSGRTFSRKFQASSSSVCSTTAVPIDHNGTGNPPRVDLPDMTQPAAPTPSDTVMTRYFETTTRLYNRTYQYVFRARGNPASDDECVLQSRDFGQTTTIVRTKTTANITWSTSSGWIYKPVTFDVRPLKATDGTGWNESITLPIGNGFTSRTINWNGCIEERQTFRGPDIEPSDDWNPIPAEALDLDIDLVPTSDVRTKWAPQLGTAVYLRYMLDAQGRITDTISLPNVLVNGDVAMSQASALCPYESRLLQQWEPAAISDYIDALTTDAYTYHDIGLIWGARLISPTGIFAARNASPDKVIDRHIVFMTDGDTAVWPIDYAAHGVHILDRRQTPVGNEPDYPQLVKLNNARTAAICKAIKDKNITLWVVSYGGEMNADTNTRLQACASTGRFFRAESVSLLISKFKAIAAEISALRLTE